MSDLSIRWRRGRGNLTIAGIGPKTGSIRTRKFGSALNSSTFPTSNSSSGKGRRAISARGFSVEYYRSAEFSDVNQSSRSKMIEHTTTGIPVMIPAIFLPDGRDGWAMCEHEGHSRKNVQFSPYRSREWIFKRGWYITVYLYVKSWNTCNKNRLTHLTWTREGSDFEAAPRDEKTGILWRWQ